MSEYLKKIRAQYLKIGTRFLYRETGWNNEQCVGYIGFPKTHEYRTTGKNIVDC